MTNPCCKYIKTGAAGPHPIYEKGTKGSKSLISAVMSSAAFITDFPADIEGNFVDFNKTDVDVLLKLYDFTEGAGNHLDTGDIGEAFGTIVGKKYYISAEMRCFLCRRKPQFELPGGKTQSLLDFFEDNLEDEAAAKKLKSELNCEEFGLATYRLNPKFSKFSCSTDGQGNCKGYKTKDYYKAVLGKCDDAKKEPAPIKPEPTPIKPEPTPPPKLSLSESFFKNYLMNGGPPLNWKYENIDISEKLKGQTLADICGGDEVFEVTYGHAITDIFGLNMAAIGSKTEAKKKVYAKQYENSIKKMFAVRGEGFTGIANPCCKFKDFNYTLQSEGLVDLDITALGPPAENDPPGYQALRSKLHKLWEATRGYTAGTDNDAVWDITGTMTAAEKCYVCRRINFVDGRDIFKDIEDDMSGTELQLVYSKLSCEQFGYGQKGQGYGPVSPNSPIQDLKDDKCPKE